MFKILKTRKLASNPEKNLRYARFKFYFYFCLERPILFHFFALAFDAVPRAHRANALNKSSANLVKKVQAQKTLMMHLDFPTKQISKDTNVLIFDMFYMSGLDQCQ